MRCEKCGCKTEAPLCEEHFFEEFEKATGLKPEWEYDEEKGWQQVYRGIKIKDDMFKM